MGDVRRLSDAQARPKSKKEELAQISQEVVETSLKALDANLRAERLLMKYGQALPMHLDLSADASVLDFAQHLVRWVGQMHEVEPTIVCRTSHVVDRQRRVLMFSTLTEWVRRDMLSPNSAIFGMVVHGPNGRLVPGATSIRSRDLWFTVGFLLGKALVMGHKFAIPLHDGVLQAVALGRGIPMLLSDGALGITEPFKHSVSSNPYAFISDDKHRAKRMRLQEAGLYRPEAPVGSRGDELLPVECQLPGVVLHSVLAVPSHPTQLASADLRQAYNARLAAWLRLFGESLELLSATVRGFRVAVPAPITTNVRTISEVSGNPITPLKACL